jgi:serine/threonine-protein kinase
VDGAPRGTSPVTINDLTPGEHSVIVEGASGSARQTVTVEAGATASLVAQLTTAPNVALPGFITVVAPSEVQLFENGRLLGSSQTDRLMVPAGSHQLEIVNQTLGYRATRSVQVTSDKVSTVKLEFPNGTIALNASPWADVTIDGAKVGQTPIGNLPVTIGNHEIVFRHPELGEKRHTATVTLTAPARLSVDMRQK